ncbi:MAG: hypothetical protein AAGF12_22480 [Myxococcota bacterium]
MRPYLFVAIFGVVFLGLGGCATTAADATVRATAAIDLDCDESALVLSGEGPMQKRVEGCGRAVTYVRRCGAADPSHGAYASRCRWSAVGTEEQ